MPPQTAQKESTYYYRNIDQIVGEQGPWDLQQRWPEVQRYADLRSDDCVLDVGCAEGLVTMEVARLVQQVRAVEVSP